MLTELTSKPEPGTLAPIFRLRPSSGWTRTTRTFGSRPSVSSRAQGGWGGGGDWGGTPGRLSGRLARARGARRVGGRPSGASRAKGVGGEEWNWIATSVAFFGSLLPALM